MADLQVTIVGYGLAGRHFHAPLIDSTPGLTVAGVVTSNRERAGAAHLDHPGAEIFSGLDAALTSAPDLVVVATSNESHAQLASAAINADVAVAVDKPIATRVQDAESLVAAARKANVPLTVFQNRRWDTDQLTLRRLIAEGALGTVTRYESRFERWRPDPDPEKWRDALPPEEGGGVLLDLGSHLVDQTLHLFGPATHVYAELASRRGGPADDDAFVAIHHASGTSSHLWASAAAPAPGPRLRVQGSAAGLLVSNLDPQEAALRAGKRPDQVADWGIPASFEQPRLIAGEQSVPVPPEPGDWPRFYALLRDALLSGGAVPVDPGDAVQVLRVLDAARESSHTRAVVALSTRVA